MGGKLGSKVDKDAKEGKLGVELEKRSWKGAARKRVAQEEA